MHTSVLGPQLIPLADGSVVAKRGPRQVLLRGSRVPLLKQLVAALDECRTVDEALAMLNPNDRADARAILTLLQRHGLIHTNPADESTAGQLADLFYSNFGVASAQVAERLAGARVSIVGLGSITRTLLAQLDELGIGRIDVVQHPALSSPMSSDRTKIAGIADRNYDRCSTTTLESLGEADLICAASDRGQASALTELNGLALRAGVAFLPVWISEMTGYVGPLNHPYETACLRCYELRVESNAPHPEVLRATREHLFSEEGGGDLTGFVPPMAGIVAEIAAMEVLKALSGIAASDTVGRQIEIGLVSFASQVRRVLKVPRCPLCSDIMLRSAVTAAGQ
jgi:bacteriocin biosynthesis cyclodehydratase domain-containing protein